MANAKDAKIEYWTGKAWLPFQGEGGLALSTKKPITTTFTHNLGLEKIHTITLEVNITIPHDALIKTCPAVFAHDAGKKVVAEIERRVIEAKAGM